MEIQMAVESQRLVTIILFRATGGFLYWQTIHSGANTSHSLCTLGIWLGIECNALKRLGAMIATEAVWMKANAGGCDYFAGDWKSAMTAECSAAT